MKHQPARGTRDLFGEALKRHQFVLETAQAWALRYGFDCLETPLFEATSVFARSLGETSDIVGKEMYTFSDRGGESLTLRPEGTASAVRAFISLGLTQTLPQKLFYSGPMFRYERPQKGRYRQFYQLGVEYLGAESPYADLECLTLAYHILQSLGLSSLELHLNTLGDQESRTLYRKALVEYLEPYQADLSPESQERLAKNPLRILDSKSEQDQRLMEGAPQISHFLTPEARQFFETVCQGLSKLGIGFVHNPKLVRGLDYYNHTAFEFITKDLGAQNAVLAGGRYNGLVENLGGPSVPGVGWAMGIDRLALLVPESLLPKAPLRIAVLPIAPEQTFNAFELQTELVQKGLNAEVLASPQAIGKRLKIAAERRNCRFALMLGETEVLEQKVVMKDLSEGKETILERDKVFEELLGV